MRSGCSSTPTARAASKPSFPRGRRAAGNPPTAPAASKPSFPRRREPPTADRPRGLEAVVPAQAGTPDRDRGLEAVVPAQAGTPTADRDRGLEAVVPAQAGTPFRCAVSSQWDSRLRGNDVL
jgi:hypothetical protein